MCLTIKNNSMTPMTAEEPILVKKAMYRRGMWPFYYYVTPFQKARIKFRHGKCEMGDGRMVLSDSIGSVFESVEGELIPRDARYRNPLVCEAIPPMVYEGIHAYQDWVTEDIITDSYDVDSMSNKIFVKYAYIPKGARYYIGADCDIVADRMTVMKKTAMIKEKKYNPCA